MVKITQERDQAGSTFDHHLHRHGDKLGNKITRENCTEQQKLSTNNQLKKKTHAHTQRYKTVSNVACKSRKPRLVKHNCLWQLGGYRDLKSSESGK